MRKRRLTRSVLAWGLIESNTLTKQLDAALTQHGREAVAQLRGKVIPPPGIDVAAQNAILLAGVFYLTIRGGITGEFAGLSLKSESDWQRVEAALGHLVRLSYQPEESRE